MIKKAIALILIAITVFWSFYVLLPSKISNIDAPNNAFSTDRALVQLKEISKAPHYLGNEAHAKVRDYIISELEKLELKTEVQIDYSMSQWGNLSKPKNVLARIPGSNSGKALLLLSHYDSNPHSSIGASDAGSGVVTILEGIRAFLSTGKQPKNDIIILLTDGEELGLNGADIFVNKHPWAKDVGLVLNFEARGSGGPSYMLIETNQGNANLMKGFVAANPEFPVANSLAYSIYKMLPNDTDLTRFRADKDIDGFNFAFIDDHFDYHTALDTYERLDRITLEHQGSYLMPLLTYFADADLTNIKSTEDYIYFNVPLFKTVIYPFSWIIPMLIIALVLFIGLLVYGLKRRAITVSEIRKGYGAFFIALLVSGGIGFGLWKLILIVYPQYNEMLHGFTYNGHTYIALFVCIALAICFYVYHKVYNVENTASLLVAPLSFWLLICAIVAFKLQGASFFVIPVFFALLSLFVVIRQKKPNLILLALLGMPLLTIMAPLVKMFPVGLGLKILFVSCVFVVLIFSLLISVFGYFKHKNRLSVVFIIASVWFLISAHTNSHFTQNTPKPNSLIYMLDTNSNTAVWATYDDVLDAWTEAYLTKTPDNADLLKQNTIGSKYKSGFTYTKKAPLKQLQKPVIDITHDTIVNGKRQIAICITSKRQAERIEVFSDTTNVFYSATINGVSAYQNTDSEYVFSERLNNRLFSYFVTDNEPLDLIITVPESQETSLQFYECTYDLLTNAMFSVPDRKANMIPKPFVLNDAVVIKSSVTIK
ncbi:M28 family peptidase [Corallibacter sp.]|uniref:M28 family peptidase n=1 Tax=Corallibacter sp. TaxID=2038084 RepID=UPI003A942F17